MLEPLLVVSSTQFFLHVFSQLGNCEKKLMINYISYSSKIYVYVTDDIIVCNLKLNNSTELSSS
jgi:hypothetical protein